MLFKEPCISRKHFQVALLPALSGSGYALRDLGSAGGSFCKIVKKKELHPGMIIVCGKHQFVVSSIDDLKAGTITGIEAGVASESEGKDSNDGGSSRTDRGAFDEDSHTSHSHIDQMLPACEGMVREAHDLLASLSSAGVDQTKQGADLQRRLQSLQSHILRMSASGFLQQSAPLEGNQHSNSPGKHQGQSSSSSHRYREQEDGKERDRASDEDRDCKGDFMHASHSSGEGMRWMGKRMTLTCFQPDGSPIMGRSFVIGPEGATIGRAPDNDIPLCMELQRRPGEPQKWTAIDSAVSSVHAHITLDEETGSFYANDGSPGAMGKASLNGLWFRLSGPYQESPYLPLSPEMEVLIGTVRFKVGSNLTISERTLDTSVSDSFRLDDGEGDGDGDEGGESSFDETGGDIHVAALDGEFKSMGFS